MPDRTGRRALVNKTDPIPSPPGASTLVGEGNKQNNAGKSVAHQMGIKAVEEESGAGWGGEGVAVEIGQPRKVSLR